MHNDERVFVALGSNLPHAGSSGAALLAKAVAAMEAAGLRVRARSGVWNSTAWPEGSGQPDYVNAVVELDPADLSPRALYQVLCDVERGLGRERRERWAARTLDLDIVAMGERIGTFDGIILPHPRMHERPFVLAPLADIAPDWRHPVLGASVLELLGRLPLEGLRRVGALA